jgi:hypothetical protein
MDNICSEYVITLRKTELLTVRVHAQSKVEAVDLAIEKERKGEADSAKAVDVECIHIRVSDNVKMMR